MRTSGGVAGFEARHGGPLHSNALGELLLGEAALNAPVDQRRQHN